MDRLLILLDNPANFASSLLLEAVLAEVRRRSDIAVTAVCVRKPKRYHRLWRRHALEQLRRRWRRWTHPSYKPALELPWPLNLARLARHHRFRVLSPPDQNLNAPGFVECLRTDLQPTLSLTLLCGQRYRAELLAALVRPANYHNGLLPAYRGLYATNWSIYHRQPVSGFTFHWMDTDLDTGRILLDGTVPVTDQASLWELEHAKTRAACQQIPALLDSLVRRDTGRAQSGATGYYSARDTYAMRQIAAPSALDSAELQHRIRAFGVLHLQVNQRWYKVAQLVPAHDNVPRFQAADGVWLTLSQYKPLKHLPRKG